MADIPWCGSQADKLYLQSGEITATLKTSQAVGSIDTNPHAIDWDGTDTPWGGQQASKLYLQSGQFTSTLKTSFDVAGTFGTSVSGTAIVAGKSSPSTVFSGTSGTAGFKWLSGQFSSTVLSSLDVNSIDTIPTGMSADRNNSPWCGTQANKLYLHSGRFTSTLKDSEQLATDCAGISWTGVDTPWCGETADKLYVHSGQFTSTLKDSQSVSAVDTDPFDCGTTAIVQRMSWWRGAYNAFLHRKVCEPMPKVPVDTAIVVSIGPVLDDTDFKTQETAIAFNAAGMSVQLLKSAVGGTAGTLTSTSITPTSGGSNDWTHRGGGIYELEITAAQNNTEGTLQVIMNATGVLPAVSPVYEVVPTAVFNSLVLGTDTLQADVAQWANANVATPDSSGHPKVTIKSGTAAGELSITSGVVAANATQISGDATAADNAESFFDGTGYAGTGNTIPTVTNVTNQVTANVAQISGDSAAADNAELFFEGAFLGGNVNDAGPAAGDFDGNAGLSATDDFYNGCALTFTVGTLKGITRKITDYTGSSKNLVFGTPFPAAPANGDTFVILGRIE